MKKRNKGSNSSKVGLALVACMCVSGASYAEPINTDGGLVVRAGETIEADAESKISITADNSYVDHNVYGVKVQGNATSTNPTKLIVGEKTEITSISTKNNDPHSSVTSIYSKHATVELKNGVTITTISDGVRVPAVSIYLSEETTLTAGDNITIKSTAKNNTEGTVKGFATGAHGLNNTAIFGKNLILEAKATQSSSTGIELTSDGSSNPTNSFKAGDGLKVTSTTDYGYSAQAITINSGVFTAGNDAKLKATTGNNAYGLRAVRTSDVTFGDRLEITAISTGEYGTYGDDGNASVMTYGIQASGSNTSGDGQITSNVKIGDNTTIISTVEKEGLGKGKGNSLALGINADEGAKVDLGANAKVITNSAERATAVFIERDGFVDMGKDSIISATGKEQSIGIRAKGFEISYNNDRTVLSKSPGAAVFDGKENLKINVVSDTDATGVWSTDGGEVKLNGAEITATLGSEVGSGDAIYAVSGGQVKGTLAQYDIRGNILNNVGYIDIDSKAGGIIELNLDQGSYILGASRIYEDNGIKGKTTLNMTGTAWDMTGASEVTNLNFSGAQSNINFLGTDKNNFITLTSETLKGNDGLFNMRTDIVGGESDKLKVTGTAEGNHLVHVENNGSAATDGTERLTIIDTIVLDDATNSFKLTNKVEVGGYQYELRRNPDEPTDWELYSTGKSTDPGDGGVNLFGSNYMMAYAETQTLMQRLGDLRRGEEPERDGDIWARSYGGKLSSKGDSMLRGYDMNYWGIQAGVDKRIDQKDGTASSYIGGFFGYTNGSPSYKRGDGDIDSFSIGGYYTYMHQNGIYTDFVLKYGWMDSDYDIRDSAGQKVKADAENEVLSLSLEVGKRFHFDKETQEGYYIEPQAQFTYTHFGGDSYKASNGLHTKVNSFTSKLARLGMHLGYETKNTKNPMNLYIKGYFMKEFDGNIDYRFNGGNKHTSSYEDNWFVYGFGLTTQLGSKKNQNLYLDFERSSGGRMKQDWAINVGYRYNW